MKRYALDEAPEGATIAKEVDDAEGRPLLREGAVLTKVWKDRLRVRGVTEVVVVTEEDSKDKDLAQSVFFNGAAIELDGDSDRLPADAAEADASEALRESITARLRSILEGVEDWEIADRLRQVAAEYFEQRKWKIEE